MNINIILTLFLSLISCSKSNFSSGKSPVVAVKSDNTNAATDPTTGKPANEVLIDTRTGLPVGEVYDPKTGKPVGEVPPGDSCKWKNGRILILDLKSGWFAGDGGNYYTTVTNTVCGGNIKIDYYHIEKKVLEINQNNISDILGCKFVALPINTFPIGTNTLPNAGVVIALTDSSVTTNNSSRIRRQRTNLPNSTLNFNNTALNMVETETSSSFTTISANMKYTYNNALCTDNFDMSIYDEFWLLSGDDNDNGDLQANSPLVNTFIKRAIDLKNKKPNAGFFIGAGISNVNLGNKFIKNVFNEFNNPNIINNHEQGLFARNQKIPPGMVVAKDNLINKNGKHLVPGDGLVPGTFNNQKSFLQKFGNGNFAEMASIFDYAQPLVDFVEMVNNYTGEITNVPFSSPCYGDAIKFTPSNNLNALILATDYCGQPTIAEFKIGGHKIVVDSNLARFYNSDVSYFQRIAQYLLQ